MRRPAARAARRSCSSRTIRELAALADAQLILRDGRAGATSVPASAGGGAMRFVLRMRVRELRASWRRLLFFFICLSVGVGAIVAIRSVIQSVRQS